MRVRAFAFHYLTILLLICLALTPLLTDAQDKPPPPQFLYRDDNHLVLVNGYTGEAKQLPFEVAKYDRFTWSPDGKYLLAWLQNRETYIICINLFEVDKWAWVSQAPLSCGVQDAAFSADGSHLAYSVSPSDEEPNGSLWLYSPADEKREKLFQTTEGDEITLNGVATIHWSPTNTYLTFVKYYGITGGSINIFMVMNTATREIVSLEAPDTFYAYYDPIWSADESWFLIVLKEQYVTSSTVATTNHAGDLYLVNSETGEKYRLTYSPADYETHIHWTDDGKIVFSELIERTTTFTTEQAMHVEPISPSEMVQPEPVDQAAFAQAAQIGDKIVSPDTYIGAWVASLPNSSGGYDYQLNIGDIFWHPDTAVFSTSLPASYQEDRVLIGWRPSDYPYPLG